MNILHQVSTISSFKSKENKHDVYRGSDCMKNHTIKINHFKKKKMKLLSNEQQKSHGNAKNVIYLQKNLKLNMLKIKNMVIQR